MSHPNKTEPQWYENLTLFRLGRCGAELHPRLPTCDLWVCARGMDERHQPLQTGITTTVNGKENISLQLPSQTGVPTSWEPIDAQTPPLGFWIFFCAKEKETLNQQSKLGHARGDRAHTKTRHGSKEERHVLHARARAPHRLPTVEPNVTHPLLQTEAVRHPLKKWRHSSQNLLSTSQTKTTNRARPSSLDNSGCRRSVLLRAATVAVSTSAHRA